MRIALIDGQRREPEPRLRAVCQCCGHPVVAKCGPIRVHHWAHKAGVVCPFEREETHWHRDWKSTFPLAWQERRFKSAVGEVHIADIYSPVSEGLAVEFQHSPISLAERICREQFHRRMIWIVNGARRENDWKNFLDEWVRGDLSPGNSLRRLVREGSSALLRDWKDSKVPVFFDFGHPAIWGLAPVREDGRLVVGITFRNKLVSAIQEGNLPKMVRPTKNRSARSRSLQRPRGSGPRWHVSRRF